MVGGYPIQSYIVEGYPIKSCWGVPHPVMGVPYPSTPHNPNLHCQGGYPLSRHGIGYPQPSRPGWGTPHHPDLARGYPLSRPGMGYPHPRPAWPWYPQTWDRVPLPPQKCGQIQTCVKTLPSLILGMWAVIILHDDIKAIRNIVNSLFTFHSS